MLVKLSHIRYHYNYIHHHYIIKILASFSLLQQRFDFFRHAQSFKDCFLLRFMAVSSGVVEIF